MQEWQSQKRETGDQVDLEKRLAAYYGPQLREQPLAQSSWLELRNKLRPRRASKRWRLRKLRIRRYSNQPAPVYVWEAFTRIANETRIHWKPGILRYSVNAGVREPAVHVTLFGRQNIRLFLPSTVERIVEQDELDVLIATGLARYFYMHKPAYIYLRLLFALAVLFSVVGLPLVWLDSKLSLIIPIAIGLCLSLLGVLFVMERALAFRADALMVRWLGRSHACRGLHELADHSRTPSRRRWVEPSLVERIERVCGTRIELENKHLTMVS